MANYRIIPRFNSVKLKNNKLKVTSPYKKNVSYGFYLYHIYRQDRIEKITYQKKNSCIFNMDIKKGFYRCVFFQKGTEISPIYSNEYFLIKNKEIISVEHFVIREEIGFIIRNYDIGAKITFIVFQVTGSDKDTAPFGLEYLLLKGFNVISCHQNKNHYQDLSFETFRDVVSPYIKGKKVFLYGSSLGGYCAVYYAGAVNGRAIAAAPRLSIHPKLQEIYPDASYVGDFVHKEIIDNEASVYSPIIFIDPYQSKDVFFLKNFVLTKYPDSTILRFDYAGHEVLTHIMKTNQLDKLMDLIVSEDKDIESQLDFNKQSEFTYLEKCRLKVLEFELFYKKFTEIDDPHISAKKGMKRLKKKLDSMMHYTK